ncbi:MAG: phosphatase PAP2 family protein [candidate division Zixibacteria bacterium]|nr:phosphatase PAP2 family protein [candidate division Zixibacteria bacterium]
MRSASAESLLSRIWRNARPLDRLTAGYVAVFGLGMLTLGWSHPSTKYLVPIHLGLLVAIGAMISNWNDHRGLRGFLRNMYPAILYTFFYGEIAVAVHWLFPGFFDAQLLAFERAVFGIDVNVWLIPAQKAWLNEWMMLGYFSYYLIIPVLALTLFFQGRVQELHDSLMAVTVTFMISYAGFVLYPIAGPRYLLAGQFSGPLDGWCFVPLVNWIIASAAIHGGCMPSSHVAVAFVVLIWAYRTNRRLAMFMTPFIITLFFATVWGRFHYVSDVVVGLLVGVVGLKFAAWRCSLPRRQVQPESEASLRQVPVAS